MDPTDPDPEYWNIEREKQKTGFNLHVKINEGDSGLFGIVLSALCLHAQDLYLGNLEILLIAQPQLLHTTQGKPPPPPPFFSLFNVCVVEKT